MSKEEIKVNDTIEKSDEKGFIVHSLKSLQHDIGEDIYELPKTPDSEYIVDDSSFVPISEAIKQLGNNPNFEAGGTYGKDFDFVDGKDDGSDLPVGRTKDGNDIAVISSAVQNNIDNYNNEKQRVKDELEYRNNLNKELDTMRPTTTEQ